MQKQTTTKENATSPTQSFAEKTPKGSYLATDEQLENMPFVLRWRENKGWFITIGDMRLTEPTETKEETLSLLETDKWRIIAGMIVHVTNLLLKNPDMKIQTEDNMTVE